MGVVQRLMRITSHMYVLFRWWKEYLHNGGEGTQPGSHFGGLTGRAMFLYCLHLVAVDSITVIRQQIPISLPPLLLNPKPLSLDTSSKDHTTFQEREIWYGGARPDHTPPGSETLKVQTPPSLHNLAFLTSTELHTYAVALFRGRGGVSGWGPGQTTACPSETRSTREIRRQRTRCSHPVCSPFFTVPAGVCHQLSPCAGCESPSDRAGG